MSRILVFAVAAAVMLLAQTGGRALAQENGVPDVPSPQGVACPPRQIRWQDDCSGLRGRTLVGLDRMRYVHHPWGYATFGGELRSRVETVDSLDFAIAGAPAFQMIGYRALAHAAVYAPAGLSMFGQVIVSDEAGRKPTARSFDRNHFDMAQLFGEARGEVGPLRLALRVGRQELDVSNNRLVGLREGVTQRRSFEGVVVEARLPNARVSLFETRPVQLHAGPFDDRPDPNERFDGVSIDLRPSPKDLVTVFAFNREKPIRPGFSGDDRQSYGLRYTVNGPVWSGAAQVATQRGRAGRLKIDAWGAAGNLNYRLPRDPRTMLMLTGAYASGDGDPQDQRAGAFDPLYPNAYGLSDAPFFSQTNFLLVGLTASHRWRWIEPSLSAFVVQRASLADGIWSQGRPIPGVGGPGRHSAMLYQASARMPLSPRVDLYGTAVKGVVGDVLRRSGGHDPLYTRVEITARF